MSEEKPSEPLPTTAVPPPAPSAAPAQPQWGAPPPPSWGPAYSSPAAPLPPQPPPRRDRAALAVVLFVFGGLFLVFFAFLWLAYSAVKGEAPRLASGPRIGVVDIKGPIGMGGRGSVEAEPLLKLLKRYGEDSDMKAVVVRIDSPGGAVGTSQEILDGIQRLAEDKVVVCAMGNLAASGGLLVAMGCDRIVAEPGTLTGSIGVISAFPNVKGLLEHFNVRVNTVTAGKLKDAGSPFRDFTPEDRAYWQDLADRIHRQFIQAVADGRNLSLDQVQKFADGRVVTGEQAKEMGLVDELGGFQDAVDLAKDMAEIKGEPRLVYPPDDRARFLEELMGGVAQKVAESFGDAIRTEIGRQSASVEAPGLYYLTR
ncbi:MAG TPA: signal peptide peptidase SppA [Anaeromyxobacteraceae bacterium]|nr:signal peptide peptidase SppA [Anaeromyxobacteraceae bacterium]